MNNIYFNNYRKINNEKTEFKTSNEKFIAIIYFLPLINFYIGQILDSYNIEYSSVYSYIILYISSIYSYFKVVRIRLYESVFAIITIAFVFLFTYIIYDENIIYIMNDSFIKSNFVFFWLACFPLFLLCLIPIDYNRFLKISYNYSVIILILNIISFGIKIYVLKIGLNEYMSFAYSALVPIFICFYYNIQQHRIRGMSLPIIASMVIVAGGCRGAFVTMVFFYTLYFIIMFKMKNTKNLYIKIMILIFFLFTISNKNLIVDSVDNIFNSMGYTSRLFSSINENMFLDSSGRNNIWDSLIKNINILGHGLYGDRVITGFYAHNWVLEFLVEFGVIFGSIIVLLILFLIAIGCRNAYKIMNNDINFIMICVISIFFSKLMLSASYLSSTDFWIFLGLSINISRIKIKRR